MGTDDALDCDGSEVADGDAQLDAYAAANGVVVDNSLSIPTAPFGFVKN